MQAHHLHLTVLEGTLGLSSTYVLVPGMLASSIWRPSCIGNKVPCMRLKTNAKPCANRLPSPLSTGVGRIRAHDEPTPTYPTNMHAYRYMYHLFSLQLIIVSGCPRASAFRSAVSAELLHCVPVLCVCVCTWAVDDSAPQRCHPSRGHSLGKCTIMRWEGFQGSVWAMSSRDGASTASNGWGMLDLH